MKPITERPSNDESGAPDHQSAGVRLALAILRAYKILLSPYFGGSCRFLPSCADYAAEAVATHGVTAGSWLAARRLARCHPLCAAGHDPVPPKRQPPRPSRTPSMDNRVSASVLSVVCENSRSR